VLANGGKQTRCASDGKLSYRAECVYDGCYVIEKNAPAAHARETKPMNEIITHPDGKSEKTVLVSKDEREIHVNVDAVRTRAKLVAYANASANNLVVRKRLFAQGEGEDVDVGKRLAELRSEKSIHAASIAAAESAESAAAESSSIAASFTASLPASFTASFTTSIARDVAHGGGAQRHRERSVGRYRRN
jgi:hypothetical protein